MIEINFFRTLFQHALISFLPGTVGALLGISLAQLGYTYLLPAPDRTNIRASYWIPWRGIFIAFLVFLLPNVYSLLWFGTGRLSASFPVFIATLVFAFVVSSATYYFTFGNCSAKRRFISTLRTVCAASIGLGMIGNVYGAGGASVIISQGIATLDNEQMWTGYVVIAVLAILVDVLIGFFGWIMLSSKLLEKWDS